ncbi:MAG: acyl-CoA thioesterase [Gammaproteobacteria bacterium]
MFHTRIHPRFCDTDAMGHIGNTVIPVWLLEGREALLRMFVPDLDFRRASLVVVRTEIDFLAELKFGTDVDLTLALEKIGNSSLVVLQEIRQGETLACKARTTMVYFDAQSRRAQPIPDALRPELEKHRVVA